jgi:multimeric flavodoxin WrbA
MRIIAIQASPDEQGLTASLAAAALAGAQAAGAETELVHLCRLNVEACRTCGRQGWGQCWDDGSCVIEDGMAPLVEKMAASDGLVLATPVYFGDVSEPFKRLFDRVRRGEFSRNSPHRLQGKWVLGIAAAGGSGRGCPTCLVAMERYYQHMGMQVFDQLPASRRSREYMLVAARCAGEALVRHLDGQDAGA